MKNFRIASFLPAATEMIYALGLEEQLVGVTHECDYPAAAKQKRVIVGCAVDMSAMAPEEIDLAVSARLKAGQSLYKVDEAELRAAAPDLLITQNLCQVCGPSGNEVAEVLKTLEPKPTVLWQTPKTYDEVFAALIELGRITGREKQALAIQADAQRRLEAVRSKTAGQKKARVSFLEWVDPVYSAGHWMPSMLGWAGGEDANAADGLDSVRIEWADILKWNPEVMIVSPCGFETEKAYAQAQKLFTNPGWDEIAAVKNGRVYAVDANAYFARPGPRLIDGVELLAHLIDSRIAWHGPTAAFRQVVPSGWSARAACRPGTKG